MKLGCFKFNKKHNDGILFNNEKNPLGFECMYCHKIQYTPTYRYRETDNFYEYDVACPSCDKTQTLRQKSAMATIREYKDI